MEIVKWNSMGAHTIHQSTTMCAYIYIQRAIKHSKISNCILQSYVVRHQNYPKISIKTGLHS